MENLPAPLTPIEKPVTPQPAAATGKSLKHLHSQLLWKPFPKQDNAALTHLNSSLVSVTIS